MMKGTVMFASLSVTGESLTCTGSDDPPLCHSGTAAPTWEKRPMEWPRKYLLFGEVIHQEWAGSHGGLERLRE